MNEKTHIDRGDNYTRCGRPIAGRLIADLDDASCRACIRPKAKAPRGRRHQLSFGFRQQCEAKSVFGGRCKEVAEPNNHLCYAHRMKEEEERCPIE